MTAVAILISLLGVVVSAVSLSFRIKQYKKEMEDKMASKAFVLEGDAKLDISILNIDKKMSEFKADNVREHDQIRKDVSEKLDLILEIVERVEKKSP